MKEDLKIEVNGSETRLSNFLNQVCESEEKKEFNKNRILDALQNENAWEEMRIPVEESDGNVKYYSLSKLEE